MLSVVPPLTADRLSEAQLVLAAVESARPALWVLCVVLVFLLALSLLAAGFGPATGLLIGSVVSLTMHRCGPCWWPGRR